MKKKPEKPPVRKPFVRRVRGGVSVSTAVHAGVTRNKKGDGS